MSKQNVPCIIWALDFILRVYSVFKFQPRMPIMRYLRDFMLGMCHRLCFNLTRHIFQVYRMQLAYSLLHCLRHDHRLPLVWLPSLREQRDGLVWWECMSVCVFNHAYLIIDSIISSNLLYLSSSCFLCVSICFLILSWASLTLTSISSLTHYWLT